MDYPTADCPVARRNPLLILLFPLALGLAACETTPPVGEASGSAPPVATRPASANTGAPPPPGAKREAAQVRSVPGAPATSPVTSPPVEGEGAARISAPTAEDRENNVFFEVAQTGLDEAGRATVARHAALLREDRKRVVTLVGHIDSQGSHAYNLALTEKRLDEVTRALSEQGVPARQIRRSVQGGDGPGADRGVRGRCATPECHQWQRRVELSYNPATRRR